MRTSPIVMTVACGLLLVLAACGGDGETADTARDTQRTQNTGAAAGTETAATVYRADLQPLNTDAVGSRPSGTATVTVTADSLTIEVVARDLPPGMMHLQHDHGFVGDKAGRDASCPDPTADINGDGIIDLKETETFSGTTLVPFHADPASLEIQAHSYPTATDEGGYYYRRTVALEALRQSLQQQHGIEELDFASRVVYIHGVPEDTQLPESVQSLPGVPAHVTLPIACGALERER